ncbi:hypothetical protein [Haladaptatus sp. NG-SE-30]
MPSEQPHSIQASTTDEDIDGHGEKREHERIPNEERQRTPQRGGAEGALPRQQQRKQYKREQRGCWSDVGLDGEGNRLDLEQPEQQHAAEGADIMWYA